MNLNFKYIPILHLLRYTSLFNKIDSEYDFNRSIYENAKESATEYFETLFPAKISLPIFDDLIADNIVDPCPNLINLINSMLEYLVNMPYEVQRVETFALRNFFHILRDDYASGIEAIANDNKQYIYDISEKYKHDQNADELIENLLKIYFHTRLKQNSLVKESIVDFLKRWRYRESIFNRFSNYFFSEDGEIFLDDYLFNFDLYQGKIFRYFFEFYIRSDDPKLSMAYEILNESDISFEKTDNELDEIEKLLKEKCFNDLNDEYSDADNEDNNELEHDTEINDEITVDGVTSKPFSDFTFRLHLTKPLEHQLEDLESFKKHMTICISSINDCINNNKLPNITENSNSLFTKQRSGYVRDKSGKIVESENVDKLFQRWQRYLDVYDLRKRNMTWGEIVDKMHSKDKYCKNFYNSAPKTGADARKDFRAAELLIKSASNLSFPD